MTTLNFVVPVASGPEDVSATLAAAADNPTQFVHLFTTSPDITAEVVEGDAGVWRIRVEGPQFKSKGTALPLPAEGGADIEIRIDLKGKGLLAFAGPALGLAAGRVQDEGTKALQERFGAR